MKMPVVNFTDFTKESAEIFIEFWAKHYRDPCENLYEDNISRKPQKEQDRILKLFEWKNGGRLSGRKINSIRINFINRWDYLDNPQGSTPADLLGRFPLGGVIFRIFFLHIWKPQEYPIYDQHVYRAMVFLRDGDIQEIPADDESKIQSYVEYILFYNEFKRFVDDKDRKIDKALWKLGKFLK